jgi:hypothetical protein
MVSAKAKLVTTPTPGICRINAALEYFSFGELFDPLVVFTDPSREILDLL